jgi:RNA polymerase sigma factor (sigma-70 family)
MAEPLSNALRYLRQAVPPPEGQETDRELLRRFAAHRDEAAFSSLVQRHGPLVLSVCRRVLADENEAQDAFQVTFLVLATKAAAPGWRDSVAGWLYGVAFRAASNVKMKAARRRRIERQVVEMPTDITPPTDAVRRELRLLLDEELARLPEKYRLPLVLCYLEGKTNEEAARKLGWTKGTVSGRLAQARDLLRSRLARRGLALSAAACTAGLTENAAKATVPAALQNATVKAVLLPAAQAISSGAMSAAVAVLFRGLLHTMLLDRLKIMALGLLTMALFGAVTGWAAFRIIDKQTPDAGTDHLRSPVDVPGPRTLAARWPPAAATAPPPESADKPVPLWPNGSKAVVKNGLKVTARIPETVFLPDESIRLELTLENVSDRPVRIEPTLFSHFYTVLVDGRGTTREYAAPGVFESMGAPPPVELLSGKAFTHRQDLRYWKIWPGTGKYQLRVRLLQLTVGDRGQGEIITAPIEFTIAGRSGPRQPYDYDN